MLHHIPTPALQDRLLAEIRRVLRRAGFEQVSVERDRRLRFRAVRPAA